MRPNWKYNTKIHIASGSIVMITTLTAGLWAYSEMGWDILNNFHSWSGVIVMFTSFAVGLGGMLA
jgi:hypothetical protein